MKEQPLLTWMQAVMRDSDSVAARSTIDRAIKILNKRVPYAELAYLSDAGFNALLCLHAPESVVVGRSPDVDVVFSNVTISSSHAEFRMTEQGRHGELIVQDLNSKNHTHVNGRKVSFAVLKKGDRVQLSGEGPEFYVQWGPVDGTVTNPKNQD